MTILMWFELLGTGYEQVVSKVPEFTKRLLGAQIEDSNEVLNHSLRSCYQEAVELMRGVYHQNPESGTGEVDHGATAALAEHDRLLSVGPRVKKQLEETYFNQLVKIQDCLDRLIATAQETDVFAGDLSVAELWRSDYRCFGEFLSLGIWRLCAVF